MSMQRFDELSKKRRQLMQWAENCDKVDFQSHRRYSLRVDVSTPTLVAFCGQEYCRGNNYHECPPWFRETARAAIAKEAVKIVRQSISDELVRLDAELRSVKAEVMRVFDDSES